MKHQYAASTHGVPVHTVGTGELTALQAKGYGHPATAVTIGVWSAASNHPFPTLAVIVGATSALPLPLALPVAAVAVGVMKVRLGMVAVAVYVGSSVGATCTFDSVAGGQTPKVAREVAFIAPSPHRPFSTR